MIVQELTDKLKQLDKEIEIALQQSSLVDTLKEKLKMDIEELQEQANKLKFDSIEDKTTYFYAKELLKILEGK